MSDITPARLSEIRERAKSATGGPWEAHEEDGGVLPEWAIWMPDAGHDGAMVEDEADAEFVAHARTDVPDLLAHIDHLTAENALLRAGIESLHRPVDQFEPCPNGGWGCDEDVCTEDAYSGERYHVDQPCAPACLTCRDEDGGRDDWPCTTATLLNPPTEGETDGTA